MSVILPMISVKVNYSSSYAYMTQFLITHSNKILNLTYAWIVYTGYNEWEN
jgi:hypothetical protein